MDELKRRAAALDVDVKALTAAVDRLGDRMDRSDRDRRWFVVAIVAVIAVVALIGYVAVRAERTARAQEQLRSDVLCPLYGLILGGYTPQTRDPGPARAAYEDTFVVIRDGYRILGCTAPLVPPRSDLPAPTPR